MLSYLTLNDLYPVKPDYQNKYVNDVWGWTDPISGREFALLGRRDATVFVEVTDPVSPLVLGILPSYDGSESTWRDIKVYKDHAFVVVDARGANGMQVFDLTELRNVQNPPVTFSEIAHYDGIAQAHNIVINEETGYAYAVGSSGGDCSYGLHMIDIRDPRSPAYAGCFRDLSTGRGGSGYTHDAQCVIYHGPDTEYAGREICIGANVSAISIADVTDKTAPVAVSVAVEPGVKYAHQGWLTEDQKYYIQNDESDEFASESEKLNPRTLVWDVTVLDDPILIIEYYGETGSVDHNLYIRGNYVYEANYTAGLRILDIEDINDPRPVAYFDTYPQNNAVSFSGAWSNYPFFQSGTILVSSQREGLFILEAPSLVVVNGAEGTEELPATFQLLPAHPNPFNTATTLSLRLPETQVLRVVAYDLAGREIAVLYEGSLTAGEHPIRFESNGLPSGRYLIRATGEAVNSTQMVTLAK